MLVLELVSSGFFCFIDKLVRSSFTLTRNTNSNFLSVSIVFEVGLGACGSYSVDTDYIVAVSYLLFDTFPGAGDNPNNNPICGKKLSVSYGSTTITVQVLDKCMGCEDVFALDFSPSAFSAIANQSQGRIQGVTWSFL